MTLPGSLDPGCSARRRRACLLLCLALIGAGGPGRHRNRPSPGRVTSTTGSAICRRLAPGDTEPAMLLLGGGQWPRQAFAWLAGKAGHGHFVILRASGSDDLQHELYTDVGGVASVQTLVFHSRAAASDPAVLDIVRRADGIFIAGGDQANYVRFWQGTPLNDSAQPAHRAGQADRRQQRRPGDPRRPCLWRAGWRQHRFGRGPARSAGQGRHPGRRFPAHAVPAAGDHRHPLRCTRTAGPADRLRRPAAARRSSGRGWPGCG